MEYIYFYLEIKIVDKFFKIKTNFILFSKLSKKKKKNCSSDSNQELQIHSEFLQCSIKKILFSKDLILSTQSKDNF